MKTINHLIDLALSEDIGPGDITTETLVPPGKKGDGLIIAKESLIVAGMDIAEKVFHRLDSRIEFNGLFKDGEEVKSGETIIKVHGSLKSLLMGERTALNFLQRLSGIATLTRNYIGAMKNNKTRLVDTRKTTPGWRVLEKYAVRIGGAFNHRIGLFDGILIKDNHIAAVGSVSTAIKLARKNAHHLVKIEVEVSEINQALEAISAGADIIMLDNMNIEQIKDAVKIINNRALVEVSGGVKKESLAALCEAGVDIISSGALTHSARSVDISMRIEAQGD